jgi:hypothetical protein
MTETEWPAATDPAPMLKCQRAANIAEQYADGLVNLTDLGRISFQARNHRRLAAPNPGPRTWAQGALKPLLRHAATYSCSCA